MTLSASIRQWYEARAVNVSEYLAAEARRRQLATEVDGLQRQLASLQDRAARRSRGLVLPPLLGDSAEAGTSVE